MNNMNIIIVGCGKVGYSLVHQLSENDHNIFVIDLHADKVRQLVDEFDAQGITGNGVSFDVLSEAGIDSADLLIAVTGSDEQNLLCCCIAKQAGHCKTIARVRNPIYNSEIAFLRDKLGLDLIINPEHICADEISRIFEFPQAVKIDTFSKGKLEFIHFIITPDCLLNGVELMKLKSVIGFPVLIPLVTRGDEVIIPRGNFVFREGDIATVAAKHSMASYFFKKANLSMGKTKNVMIVGGGTISYYLTKRLIDSKINVKIIESNLEVCNDLAEEFPTATIIHGDGTDEKLLIQEGLENADGFAALTGLDEENILLALLAKRLSHTKAVSKINRINFNTFLGDLKVDTPTFPRLLTADVIIKYVRSMNDASLDSNVENLYRLEDGRAEALEFYIKNESAVTGTPIAEMNIKPEINICSILRGDQLIFPTGQDIIKTGDYVVVVMKHKGMSDITDILL